LEILAPELLGRILDNLTPVDRICLSFCSSTLHQSSELYDRLVATNKQLGSPATADDFVLLMEQMGVLNDAPSITDYCHHCLTFVPEFCLGPNRSFLGDLICMNCRLFCDGKERIAHLEAEDCHGCQVLRSEVQYLVEESIYYVDEAQVWDEIWGWESTPSVGSIRWYYER
jgi:hypothetical protein